MAAKKASKEATSNEEQIGFHKGALSTLSKERQELARMLGIVEQLMQMHVAGLKQLGVDLEKIAKEATTAAQKKSKKPIEDII
jgi:hypothetical protein